MEETAAEARVRLADRFPRQALRRMTHPGLLLGAVLDGVACGPDDAVVYATTFAETRALEDYLGSFPAASPLLFQTSIHPSAVQQILIARQQPIARLWPLAGRERIVEQALQTALLEPAEQVVVAGAEERGTWMLDHGMASDRAFAFAAVLTHAGADAIGSVSFERDAGTVKDAACPSLLEFASALAERRPLAWFGGGGHWSVAWR